MRSIGQRGLMFVCGALGGIVATRALLSAAAPSQDKAEPVEVICSSCSFPGLERTGHVVFRNPKTGELWAYSDQAMIGKIDAPVFRIGTLSHAGAMVRH